MKLGNAAGQAHGRTFPQEVEARSGVSPAECYQCGKCTAGCPMAFAMDVEPSRIMRLVQLGQRDAALKSHTIWLCASCETCTTRCPQEVDLARVMDSLRIMAREAGITATESEVVAMNEGMLAGARRGGRVQETLLAVRQRMVTLHFFQDMDKLPALVSKGKMVPSLHRTPNADEVARIFENVAKLEGEEE